MIYIHYTLVSDFVNGYPSMAAAIFSIIHRDCLNSEADIIFYYINVAMIVIYVVVYSL